MPSDALWKQFRHPQSVVPERRLRYDLQMPLSSRPTLESMRDARSNDAPPSDFASFWLATLEELARVPLELHGASQADSAARDLKHPAPLSGTFTSLGGETIRCWLSQRSDATSTGPRPLLITCHGYGGQIEPERVRRLGSFGIDVAAFDARGFGRSALSTPLHPGGYLLTGVESQETSILRGAICDYLQMRRIAQSHFGTPERVVFQGFSFAGGLSLMASAVLGLAETRKTKREADLSSPDLLATGVPTFGDHRRRVKLCEMGSGRELAEYLQTHPERAAETFRVLSYFDSVHFAPHITSRVIAGVGFFDPVVPPMTVYPILNALRERPELFELPCSHTSRPEEQEWIKWESAWIRATLGRD